MIEVYIYELIDARDDTSHAVVLDPSDGICIGGYDRHGTYRQFESEAYHIWGWAAEYDGLTIRRYIAKIDLDTLTPEHEQKGE